MPALRPARLRLLAADPGRADPRRRLPRRRPRVRVHRRRRRRRRGSRTRSRTSSRTCSAGAPRVTHRWAGVFGLDAGPAAARRAACPAGTASGSPAATPGHGNVLGLACGELVAGAILGASRTRCSSSSTPAPARRLARVTSVEAAGRSSSPARSYAAIATARSWIARPVESKTVISSSSAGPRPRRRARAPSSVTSRAPDRARLHGRGELAAVARLLPVVAEDARARDLGDRDLGLARPVRAHQAHVLSRPQRARRGAGSRGPGVTVTTTSAAERLLAARCHADAELVRYAARALRVDVPDATARGRAPRSCARRRGRSRRHRSRPRFRPACRACPPRAPLRRRCGARSRRRRRARASTIPVSASDEHDETGHGRQAARGIARERRHPLQQRVARRRAPASRGSRPPGSSRT